MGPSPWRRRRKPRHARPRSVRRRACGLCLSECLEIALGPAGQLLFLQPHGHWLISLTETDPAYIAAVLSGSRFPSRRLTIRIAHACGADCLILLKVWEDEYRRRRPDTTQPSDEPPSTRPLYRRPGQ